MRSFDWVSSTYWFWTIDRTSVNNRSCSYVAPVSVPLLATVPPIESVRTSNREPMSNAFFIVWISPPRLAAMPEPLLRVLRLTLVSYLEVQTGPDQRSAVPHARDPLPVPDVVALLDGHVRDVRVERVVLVAVIENDQVPIPLEPPGVNDVAGVHGPDLGAVGGLDVDTALEGPRAEAGMDLRSERRDQATVRRPRQPAAERAEADGGRRGSGPRRRRRRWPLGQAPLL